MTPKLTDKEPIVVLKIVTYFFATVSKVAMSVCKSAASCAAAVALLRMYVQLAPLIRSVASRSYDGTGVDEGVGVDPAAVVVGGDAVAVVGTGVDVAAPRRLKAVHTADVTVVVMLQLPTLPV